MGDTESNVSDATPIVLVDTLLATGKVLQWLEISDTVLAEFDRLSEHARRHDVSLQQASGDLGIALDAPMVALIMQMMLYRWFDNGAEQTDLLRSHMLLGHMDLDERRPDDLVVIRLAEFLSTLHAMIEHNDPPGSDHARDAAEELCGVGDALIAVAAREEATRCYDACCNLVGVIGHPDYRRYAEKAVRHVHAVHNDERLTASIRLKAAAALVAQAENDPACELRAFDAIYDALLAMREQVLLQSQSAAFFEACLAKTSFRRLGPLYVVVNHRLDRARLPESIRDIKIVPQITSHDIDAWVADLLLLGVPLAEAENGRLALEPTALDSMTAQADWSTWGFVHPAYYRAIPDAGSILRDSKRENLMLVLAHEVTHIYTMNGYLGLTVLSIRAAIMQLMFDLWVGHVDERDAAAALTNLPPLKDHTLMTLAFSEQVLQLIRKLQIIGEVWAPWFEGIAVFNELSNPADDAASYGHHMGVMYNLVDRGNSDIDNVEGLQALVESQMAEIEKYYGEAVQNRGRDRLMTYLVAHHHTYLAGYLAVRSVVATWRQTLNEPLDGTVAGRILLHVTRMGTQKSIPDLALPLDQFERAAVRTHVDWVKQLRDITAQDLRDVDGMTAPTSPHSAAEWHAGRLEVFDSRDPDRETALQQYALEQAKRAWSGLRGERADQPQPAIGDESDILISIVARAFDNLHHDDEFAASLLRKLATPLSVLQIASVQARFWLNHQSSTVFCLLRTSEDSGADGGPGYNGVLFSLEQAEFDALMQRIDQHGDTRMTVMRFVDLAHASVSDDRGWGRHCLVFQYHDWLHIQMRGLAAGKGKAAPSLVDALRQRLVRDAFGVCDETVIADGKPFASHARDWIDTADQWTEDGVEFRVAAWVERVRRTCDHILYGAGVEFDDDVRKQLLLKVAGFDERQTSELSRRGLRALLKPQTGSLQDTVALLLETAQRPRANGVLADAVNPALFDNTALGVDVRSAGRGTD